MMEPTVDPRDAITFMRDAVHAYTLGWTDIHIRITPQLFFLGQVDINLWGIPPNETELARIRFGSSGTALKAT